MAHHRTRTTGAPRRSRPVGTRQLPTLDGTEPDTPIIRDGTFLSLRVYAQNAEADVYHLRTKGPRPVKHHSRNVKLGAVVVPKAIRAHGRCAKSPS